MKALLQIQMGHRSCNRATPVPLLRGVLLTSFLLLGILLLASCARSPKRVPDVPPEPAPVTSPATDDAPHLKTAEDRQAQGDFSTAIRILQSFLDAHPNTDLYQETQVALGRTYELSGDREAALLTYRKVLKHRSSPSSRNFKQQARERIAVLETRAKQAEEAPGRSVAVMVHASQVPPRKQWERWLEDLQQAEVTTLILEVGTKPVQQTVTSRVRPAASKPSGHSPGVYFQTTWAPVKRPVLNQIVPIAQNKGIAVFGAVTLRRMPWLEPPVGWADWVYQLDTNRLERSQELDIFNPAVQKYHVGFLADLAKTGIAGLFFRADASMGPFEGLTRFALAGFRRQYNVQLNARILFLPRPHAARPSRSKPAFSSDSKAQGVASRFSPAYWKWEGWKVREQLRVMTRYITALRKQVPALQFVVEVHPEAISKPIEGMLRYSEDVVEAKQLGIQYLATPMGRAGKKPVMLSGNGDQVLAGGKPPTMTFMAQALDVMEEPEDVWVMRHLPDGQVANIGELIPVERDQLSLPKGVGLLYSLGGPVLP